MAANPPPVAPGRFMRLLQRTAMVQHGQRLEQLLHSANLRPEAIHPSLMPY